MHTRVAAISAFCLGLCLAAAPARAQYAARGASDPATGETYHVELGGYIWNPTPELAITSESLGIVGSRIDFVTDLGIQKARFKQIKLVLRPSKKTKFRFEYTPITYSALASPRVEIIFNGHKYPISIPVQTDLEWKAYRFGYEYDFVYTDRGFFGLLLEAKYTKIQASLKNIIDTEFVEAKAPIPAIGAIGRVYVAPNISITAELSGFPGGVISSIDEQSDGHFFDFDLYGTVNFTDHYGAQAGYRSFDVFYKVDTDQGEMKLKGLYFGGVVRF